MNGRANLEQIAVDQWGLVSRRQAELAGVPPTTLDRYTAPSGVLVRVASGVYRLRGAPEPDHLDLRAAWLQLAPEVSAWARSMAQGVVSHRSAAAVYGIGHLPADVHEFTIPRRKQTRRPDVRIHVRPLDNAEVATVQGLPLTRPARIAVDLIRDREDPEAIAQVVADALRLGLEPAGTFVDGLAAYARRFCFADHDGSALLRWFLDLAGAPDTDRWMTAVARSGNAVTHSGGYATPAALRAALTDRIKAAAKNGPWSIPQLQRHVAYDRFLERLYLVDEGWIVKGATALLAREIGVRGSLDIDVYRRTASEIAEADVRRAASIDLGDWFRFELGGASAVAEVALRLPIRSVIGTTTWVQFHLDLLGDEIRMTGQPDDVPPLAGRVIPDIEQHGYRAYPLADHIADKVAATFARYGRAQRPSTRYRDLVDLVAIVTAATVDAVSMATALKSEFARRGIALPTRFDVPDRPTWQTGYAAEARRSLLTHSRTLDEAVAIVRGFLDPVFAGSATGRWDPSARAWA